MVSSVQLLNVQKSLEETLSLTAKMMEFWSNCRGWAPEEAVDLLQKSRLDKQCSLTEALLIWVNKPDLIEGELILAWVNL